MARKQMSAYDRTYVLERILEASKTESGVPEAKIRSSGFLSFTEIDWYLRNMIENDLIRYNADAGTYKTTKHGEDFLKTMKQMGDLLSLIEE